MTASDGKWCDIRCFVCLLVERGLGTVPIYGGGSGGGGQA